MLAEAEDTWQTITAKIVSGDSPLTRFAIYTLFSMTHLSLMKSVDADLGIFHPKVWKEIQEILNPSTLSKIKKFLWLG